MHLLLIKWIQKNLYQKIVKKKYKIVGSTKFLSKAKRNNFSIIVIYKY